MNTYIVLETKQCDYNWLVIATSYISPLLVLDDLRKELRNETGCVLFDMTLINGMEYNRYISALMNNGTFDRTSFKAVATISDNLRSISRKFFVEHPALVDESVISKPIKYLLKAGNV